MHPRMAVLLVLMISTSTMGQMVDCCVSSGNCLQMTTQAYCDQLNGTAAEPGACYDPDWCAPPVRYSCCWPDYTCEYNVDPSVCQAGGGKVGSDQECNVPTFCDADWGDCCLPDGTCDADIWRNECEGFHGGTFGPEGSCQDPLFCTLPGDCCWEPGDCQEDVLEAICEADGGTSGPLGSCQDPWFCSPRVDCCRLPGDCLEDVPIEICDTQGGLSRPVGSCQDPLFCSPLGACCLQDQCYEDMMTALCVMEGGTVAPPGRCDDPSFCGEPGDCCLPDGTCIGDIREDQCAEQHGGTWAPAGACNEVGFCTVACCLPNGECADVLTAMCTEAQGTPAGDACTDPGVECGYCLLPYNPRDFNQDCRVDLLDLAFFAQDWLDCNWLPQQDCWQLGG